MFLHILGEFESSLFDQNKDYVENPRRATIEKGLMDSLKIRAEKYKMVIFNFRPLYPLNLCFLTV